MRRASRSTPCAPCREWPGRPRAPAAAAGRHGGSRATSDPKGPKPVANPKIVAGRRGRASRHVHVNWQNRIGAAPHAVVVVEDAARAPASPVRHHNLRIGGRMVGPKRRLPHGARHGPGIDEHIRMARRGHDLYAEALRVEDRGDGGENLDLAPLQPPQSTR